MSFSDANWQKGPTQFQSIFIVLLLNVKYWKAMNKSLCDQHWEHRPFSVFLQDSQFVTFLIYKLVKKLSSKCYFSSASIHKLSLYKSQFMTLAGEKSLQQKNPFVRLRRDYWLADFLCQTVSFTWFLPLVVYLVWFFLRRRKYPTFKHKS